MKRDILVKLPNTYPDKKKKRKLINVCAWCPQATYPKLGEYEDYTHGLCEKHYDLLKQKRNY